MHYALRRCWPSRRSSGRKRLAQTRRLHSAGRTIREAFDHAPTLALVDASRLSTGLFGNKLLTSPEGLQRSSHIMVAAAMRRVHDIVNHAQQQGQQSDQADIYRRRFLVKDFDQLSNAICMLTDTAEFLRNAHPSVEYAQAANGVYGELSSLLNELNTNVQLFTCLHDCLQDKNTIRAYSTSEQRNARVFHHDFVKSGIHLPAAQRERHVQLSDEIVTLSRQFVELSGPPTKRMTFRKSDLDGVSMSTLAQYSVMRRRDHPQPRWHNSAGEAKIEVNVNPDCGSLLVSCAHNEQVRKQAFLAMNGASAEQLRTLETLLTCRHNLAQLTGHNSYGSLALEDKMCHTPEAVYSFLLNSANDIRSKYRDAITDLEKIKGDCPVQQWDKPYLLRKYNSQQYEYPTIAWQPTLGTSLAVFVDLMRVLYDVTMNVELLAPGEAWHDCVRKLVVSHKRYGTLGVIYCDLAARDSTNGREQEKWCHAAHFTVRGRRRVDLDFDRQGSTDLRDGINNNTRLTSSETISESMKLQRHSISVEQTLVQELWQGPLTPLDADGLWQIPAVVLIANFKHQSFSNEDAMRLSRHDVETLWHELGHAMHSVLSLSDFQNLSGTRCALDFSEIPSVLMEQFLMHPAVCARFQHYEPQLPSKPSLLTSHVTLTQVLETQTQLYYALVDQMYHSEWIQSVNESTSKSSSGGFTSEIDAMCYTHLDKVPVRDFQTALGKLGSGGISVLQGLPYTEHVYWQVSFQHLATYSAGYYTYLWSRMISRRIFDRLFLSASDDSLRNDVINNNQTWETVSDQWNESGEKLWREVLMPGNGRDPWECINGVLGADECERLRQHL